MASDTETAWAAGLFEGEGCISTMSPRHHGKQYGPYGRLNLQMNDQDVVGRFADVVGVGTVNHHRLHSWHCGRATEVLDVLRSFWPYLGTRRKVRAMEIAAMAATTGRTRQHGLL